VGDAEARDGRANWAGARRAAEVRRRVRNVIMRTGRLWTRDPAAAANALLNAQIIKSARIGKVFSMLVRATAALLSIFLMFSTEGRLHGEPSGTFITSQNRGLRNPTDSLIVSKINYKLYKRPRSKSHSLDIRDVNRFAYLPGGLARTWCQVGQEFPIKIKMRSDGLERLVGILNNREMYTVQSNHILPHIIEYERNTINCNFSRDINSGEIPGSSDVTRIMSEHFLPFALRDVVKSRCFSNCPLICYFNYRTKVINIMVSEFNRIIVCRNISALKKYEVPTQYLNLAKPIRPYFGRSRFAISVTTHPCPLRQLASQSR
jgi:hypothetical protein